MHAKTVQKSRMKKLVVRRRFYSQTLVFRTSFCSLRINASVGTKVNADIFKNQDRKQRLKLTTVSKKKASFSYLFGFFEDITKGSTGAPSFFLRLQVADDYLIRRETPDNISLPRCRGSTQHRSFYFYSNAYYTYKGVNLSIYIQGGSLFSTQTSFFGVQIFIFLGLVRETRV